MTPWAGLALGNFGPPKSHSARLDPEEVRDILRREVFRLPEKLRRAAISEGFDASEDFSVTMHGGCSPK